MSHIKESKVSNLTNEELLVSVQHEFPNIRGLLKQLVDRFEEIIDNLDLEANSDGIIDCPNCGTKIPTEVE